jgi:F420-non-reducing hydrogenase small subunit
MVDLHEKLLNLVDEVEFVRIPVLMDEKGYPEADVGIVEGAVRSAHDREALLKMRNSVKTLIAFGTCASYGGPSGIGWLHGRNSIIDKVYGDLLTTGPSEKAPTGVPELEKSVVPIDEVVKVDFQLPGCPPHPYYIALALRTLLGASGPVMDAKPVCSQCERKMEKRLDGKLRKGAVSAPESDVCFLSQGVVCLGSVTLNRCQTQCPNKGVVCAGCAGPSPAIIMEPQLDIRTMVAKRMNLVSGIPESEILEYMEEEAKTFYSYALSSPVFYRKPTVEIREWARERCSGVKESG